MFEGWPLTHCMLSLSIRFFCLFLPSVDYRHVPPCWLYGRMGAELGFVLIGKHSVN